MTGEHHLHPRRYININDVIDIKEPGYDFVTQTFPSSTGQSKLSKAGLEVKEGEPDEVFDIAGSKGESHRVTRHGRRWHCTCKGFMFHKGHCKHLNQVLKEKLNA